jgi:glycosyltransferase involved in cell wall biosynthesis
MVAEISVVVPSYNDKGNLIKCLCALEDELSVDDEIIVVDNGSTDGSLDVASGLRNVQLHSLSDGTIAAVRNYGAKQARHEIVGFVDSDCVVVKGWKAAAFAKIVQDDVVAVGSKYQTPLLANWIEKAWFSQRPQNGDVKYINAGNFVVKKEAFWAVGGFDEALITGEDAEICIRLIRAGGRVVEHDSIRTVHLGNPKSLVGFFCQQKWHSVGMFGTFRHNFFDKPLLMTVLFVCCVVSVPGLYVLQDMSVRLIVVSFGLVLLVPCVSAIFRVVQFGNWGHICSLSILYIVYYMARSYVLFEIIFENLLSRKKSN